MKKIRYFLLIPSFILILQTFNYAVSNWEIGIIDNSGNVYNNISTAFDSNNYPHISYQDFTNNLTNSNLKYAYYDGTHWIYETVDSNGKVGSYSAIALDENNYPHISYYDQTNDTLKYAYFDGTTWHRETVDSGGLFTSLALDKNNLPHIGYHDFDNRSLKYAYFDGTSWHTDIVDNDGYVGGYLSLALDRNNHPHISYFDYTHSRLKYAYFDGITWQKTIVDNLGGMFSSIALDSYDYPHISYYSSGLKYAYFDGTSWHTDLVDNSRNVGKDSSIALDTYNHPHISYYDEDNKNLKYAYYDGTNWHIETVDSNGGVGRFSSITLDSYNAPYIAYRDENNKNLKYAYKRSPYSYYYISMPSGPHTFYYPTISTPEIASSSENCKPFSVGDIDSGIINIQIGLPNFTAPADIYLAVSAPPSIENIYVIWKDNSLHPLSEGISPWKENTIAGMMKIIYRDIPTQIIPEGTYYLWVLVTPHDGNFNNYYLWQTDFTITH